MAVKARYKPEYKKYVVTALQVMLGNLYENLRISDNVSLKLDTEEEHRKTLELCDLSASTPEELRESVEEAKDRSIRELGHIQKRIAEVRGLKEAFEDSEVPSPDVLNKTYSALRSSLIFESMQLCIGNPREKIFATGIASLELGKEKADEVERLGKTIQAYTDALFFGFNLFPLSWSEFPFDSP